MLVYNLMLAASVVLGIPLCKSQKGKLVYCILAGGLLFTVAAVRQFVGYDYNSYGTIYIDTLIEEADTLSNVRFEKGFLMICNLLGDYFISYQTLFIVMAGIITVPLMIHIYRYCDKPYMAVFGFLTLGLYFNSLNFIRQIIAALIVMLGLRYVESGKFFRFAIVVVLASCFHISAFMMLLFYFALKIKITPVVLAVYSGISVLVFIFSYQMLSIVTTYVYRNYDPANSIHMTTGLFPIYTIYFGILFIAAFILREPLEEKNSFNNVLISCMFFAVFFEFIGIKHSIVSRPSLYFLLPASVELVPQIFDVLLEKCREKFKEDKAKQTIAKALVITSLTLLCTGMFEYMIVKGYNGVTPYQTVFDEEPEY